MVSNEQQNMDIGYKAEFRLIRTDYRRDSSLNKSGGAPRNCIGQCHNIIVEE